MRRSYHKLGGGVQGRNSPAALVSLRETIKCYSSVDSGGRTALIGRLLPEGIPRGFPCYDRPMTEALQDELDRLKQRREDLKSAIAAKKREAAQLQKKQSQALENQLRRVRSRLSSSERKLRTRRLMVLGSLMEKEVPPAALLNKLDRALDRDQDRALFDLPPKSPAGADRTPPAASAPLEGWRPAPSPRWLLGKPLRGSQSRGSASEPRRPHHHRPRQKR